MKRLLLLLLVFISGISFAGNVSKEFAHQVAVSFWQSATGSRGVSPSLQLVFHSENISARSSGLPPAYYVFDNVNGPGFVIVAGDDAVMPVLGYSFDNEFSADNIPVNMKGWLENVRDEVNSARSKGLQSSDFIAQEWKSVSASLPVVQLKTAKWNQDQPYNLLCPTLDGQATYTGCVITALAIVMRYHQWPERGIGTLPGYETYTHKIQVQDLPLGHAYDWSNMLLEYPYSSYSQIEATAVATLMRDCGIMLQADYCPLGSSGTSASTFDIPSLLSTFMGYKKSARFVGRSFYSTSEWNSLMKNELDNNRPIIYSGSNQYAGHAFVLDGYTDNDYYGVNWGWGGYCNGYFLLNSLDPSDQEGTGGSGDGFNNYQDAVIGITKDSSAEPVEELRFIECLINGRLHNGFSVDETVVSGKDFILYVGGLNNAGSTAFTGDIMFAVTDNQGNIVEELCRYEIQDLPPSYYTYNSFNVKINCPILPGYRIRGYFRSINNPEWKIILGNDEEGCVWDMLIADEFSIEETTQLTYNKKNRLLKLSIKEGVSVTLRSSSGNDFSDLCKMSNNEVTIDTGLLSNGTYSVTLQKGNDIKTLNFSISNTDD